MRTAVRTAVAQVRVDGPAPHPIPSHPIPSHHRYVSMVRPIVSAFAAIKGARMTPDEVCRVELSRGELS